MTAAILTLGTPVLPVGAQLLDDRVDTSDEVVVVTGARLSEARVGEQFGATGAGTPQLLETASTEFNLEASLDGFADPVVGADLSAYYAHRPADYAYYPDPTTFTAHQMLVDLGPDWQERWDYLEFAVFYKRDDIAGATPQNGIANDPGEGAHQLGTLIWEGGDWESLLGLNEAGTIALYQNAYEAWVTPISEAQLVITHVYADPSFVPTFTVSWADVDDPESFGFRTSVGEAPAGGTPVTDELSDEDRANLPTDWITVTATPVEPSPAAEPGADGPGEVNPPGDASATDVEPEPVPEAAAESTDAASDDGGLPVLLLVAVPIVGVGLVFVVVQIVRRRERGAAAGVPVTDCSCEIEVAISGPPAFRVCCMKPDISLGPARLERQTHLDADVRGRDGWDLFDALYEASITPGCTGGGEVLIDEATYQWHVTDADDSGFRLHVRAAAPVRCADGGRHDNVVATAILPVVYEDAACTIRVLIQRVGVTEVSHVDIHIMCGTYSEVFGFFAKEGHRNITSVVGVPAEVGRHRATEVNELPIAGRQVVASVRDGIGAQYEHSHAEKSLEVWDIGPVDCAVCDALRNEWELLAADPGEYYLTENNCATQAYTTLATAGAIKEDPVRTMRPGDLSGRLSRLRSESDSPWPISEPYTIR